VGASWGCRLHSCCRCVRPGQSYRLSELGVRVVCWVLAINCWVHSSADSALLVAQVVLPDDHRQASLLTSWCCPRRWSVTGCQWSVTGIIFSARLWSDGCAGARHMPAMWHRHRTSGRTVWCWRGVDVLASTACTLYIEATLYVIPVYSRMSASSARTHTASMPYIACTRGDI